MSYKQQNYSSTKLTGNIYDIRSEAGFAYVAILFILIILSLLSLAFLQKVGTETSATMNRGKNMQAHYLAESAANHALWRLLNESTFPEAENIYYMHTLGQGRYGYKVHRHTDTTFATIATVGAIGESVVNQSYVLYVKPPPAGTDTLCLGLVGYWELDEILGTDAADSSGNGNDGLLMNMDPDTDWVSGNIARALDFDGINDNVVVSNNENLSVVDYLTVAAWIKADVGSFIDWSIIANKGSYDTYNYWFGTIADDITFGFSDGEGEVGFKTSALNLNTNIWYHIAATFDTDANEVRVYLNGSEVESWSTTRNPTASTEDLFIGKSRYSNEFWKGKLDDVRIYNRALDASEIAQLHTLTEGSHCVQTDTLCTGLVGYWQFDEDSGTVAADSSGTGNDGTLMSMDPATDWVPGNIAGALDFDGSNDYVQIPDNANLSIGDEFTIAAWVWANSEGFQNFDTVAVKTGTSFNFDYYFGTYNDKLTFLFYYGANIEGFDTPTLNLQVTTWYHIAVTFDTAANEVRFYLNGSVVDVQSTSNNPVATTGDLQISGTGERWNGKLDDVRIYNRALDASEIAQLYGLSMGSDCGDSGCDGTFRDEFNTQSFSGSDGTLSWTGDWFEVGESDGATSGDVMVTDDESNYQLQIQDNNNGGEGVEREMDLAGASTATLTFDYRRQGLNNPNDYVKVEISANGVTGPWTEIGHFAGGGGGGTDSAYQPYSQNISAYISGNTRIRFISSPNMGNTDIVWFDNVEICVKN